MCVFSFDDGMAAESWYAWLALRRRVSMSAIGSVIVMACRASLAAVPHASCAGLSAIGGALVRGWNGRPVWGGRGVLPAGLAHAGQLPGVGHLPQADPAQAELAEDRVRAAAPLAAGVAADRELGLAGRLVDQRLLGHVCLSPARLSGSSQRIVLTTGWPAKGNPS